MVAFSEILAGILLVFPYLTGLILKLKYNEELNANFTFLLMTCKILYLRCDKDIVLWRKYDGYFEYKSNAEFYIVCNAQGTQKSVPFTFPALKAPILSRNYSLAFEESKEENCL